MLERGERSPAEVARSARLLANPNHACERRRGVVSPIWADTGCHVETRASTARRVTPVKGESGAFLYAFFRSERGLLEVFSGFADPGHRTPRRCPGRAIRKSSSRASPAPDRVTARIFNVC